MRKCKDSLHSISAWFSGSKAEHGEEFASLIRRIVDDYHHWCRNYFPEDGFIVDSSMRRMQEEFNDRFEDRLMELLARLKADFPFHSPRYAAHMVSAQTMPSIAGYFATMLYNPNNVTSEAAPVTVRLELEAAQMIAKMLGYDENSWAHLTSCGTIANLEGLWVARSVKYLPFVLRDVVKELGIESPLSEMSQTKLLGMSPQRALGFLEECWSAFLAKFGNEPDEFARFLESYRNSPYNVAEYGLVSVCNMLQSEPVLLMPETHHYSFSKIADILGLGRHSLIRVKVDRHFRMKVKDLEEKIHEIEKEGKHVLAVVPVVGTTEEGAIDPVDAITSLREERESGGASSFWIHADSAYGGYLRTVTVPKRIGLGEPTAEVLLGGEVRKIDLHLPEKSVCDALEDLGKCDSNSVDPHKLGYCPYPAGAICFKSKLVKWVVRQYAPYIEKLPISVAPEFTDGIGSYILEGSKPGAAAASVWLSHTLIPLDNEGHGLLIRETVRNASEFAALLERRNEFAENSTCEGLLLCPPDSNVVCFLFRPVNRVSSLAEINELNSRIFQKFSISPDARSSVYTQKFFISRTLITTERYSEETLADFLKRLGVSIEEYRKEGVFLLRVVLMNPWYTLAKEKGRYFLSEFVEELYREANSIWESMTREKIEAKTLYH
ncbi:MAG TPA: pyridoxal-dependent decarboxylase [Fimbriimonadales bacterium]|nr:pyridoxal-dependent decarboxylase [Fimbriimonadales bacterium]